MPDRRALAKPIRARQEVAKLLDAWRMPKAPPELPAGAPQLFVPDRQRPGLPRGARHELLAEAAKVAAGSWRTFGAATRPMATPVPWCADVSRLAAPLTHWSRVRVLHGPGGADIKEVWELNRHRGLLRLAQAWYLERDSAWAASLASHLDSWLEQNPPGLGINWASSLEVAFRALTWTWIRALTRDATIWTAARDHAFASSLWHHGRHLARYDSVHHSPNTHLTGEGLALALLGRAWPDWPAANDWKRLGDTILVEELQHQVLPDGMHTELSPGYHRYTVEFYLLWIASRLQAGESVPDELLRTVAPMVEALAALRRPDGRLPGIGDEDGGVMLPLGTTHSRDPGPVLGFAVGLLGGEVNYSCMQADSLELAWWILPDQRWDDVVKWSSSPPKPARSRLKSLASAGYHVLREPNDTGWWCLVDAGPQSVGLPGHSHCDLGHVELQWNRTPLVTDPGSLLYGPDQARRDRDRAQESHAALTVVGAPLAQPTGPFRWTRLAPTPQADSGSHADWATVTLAYDWRAPAGARFRHERQVCLVDEAGVVVVDRLSGADGHTLMLSWPIPVPSTAVSLGTSEALLPANVRLQWIVSGALPLTARLEDSDFADTYRTPMPGTFLRLQGEVAGNALVVSWFTAPGQSPRISTAGTLVRIERPGRTVIELAGGVS